MEFSAPIDAKKKARMEIAEVGFDAALARACETRDRNSIMSLDYCYWNRVASAIECLRSHRAQPVLFMRSYPPTIIRHVIRWCEANGRTWRSVNTRGGDICGAPLTEEEAAEIKAIRDRYDSPERAEMKAEVRIPRKAKS